MMPGFPSYANKYLYIKKDISNSILIDILIISTNQIEIIII